MWRLPQTKAPHFPPHSSSLSLHMVTGQPARGNYTHSPACEVLQRPQSQLTRSRLTPYRMHNRHKHLHMCMQTVCPLSLHPTSLSFSVSFSLLARSEIITHFEWLWKVYSFFFKSNKNNRVTIMLSDVAVSFHCMSSSSGLVTRWHRCRNTSVCFIVIYVTHLFRWVTWLAKTKKDMVTQAE